MISTLISKSKYVTSSFEKAAGTHDLISLYVLVDF